LLSPKFNHDKNLKFFSLELTAYSLWFNVFFAEQKSNNLSKIALQFLPKTLSFKLLTFKLSFNIIQNII
jgi:hypothetical protein